VPAEKPAPPVVLIKYINSYATALEQAKAQNKPILMQYTSASCGWCTVKEKEIDADPYMADFINRNFIPVLNPKDGKAIRDKYKPGVPHTLILTTDGEKLIHHGRGYSLPAAMFDYLDRSIALNQLATRNPEAFDLYISALESNKAKDRAKAMQEINSAIEMDDKCWPLFSQRAFMHYYAEDYDAAIKDLTKAKSLSPKSPDPIKNLGIMQIAARRYLLGARELENARKLMPRGDQQMVMYQAGALSRIGKRADAIKLLEAAAARKRDSGYYFDDSTIRALSRVNAEEVSRAMQNKRYHDYSRNVIRWTMAGLVAAGGDKPSATNYLKQAFDPKLPDSYPSRLARIDLKVMGIEVQVQAPAKPATKQTTSPEKPADQADDQESTPTDASPAT